MAGTASAAAVTVTEGGAGGGAAAAGTAAGAATSWGFDGAANAGARWATTPGAGW